MKRNRLIYFALIITTIGIGIGSRKLPSSQFVTDYLGDYLYAVMFFWIIGFLFTKTATIKVTIISVFICYGIEFLQLYQAHWINVIRNTKLGGLVLGFGFLWTDIICYTLGGLTGYVLEKFSYKEGN